MEAPPDYGDPYVGVPSQQPNANTWGAVFAWDGVRYFWGTVINEAWDDINNIILGGEPV